VNELRECSIRIGGRRMRYLVGGSGRPLLLCHGFLGSAENFATWYQALIPRRTLVIPDLPGCGASDPLPGPHTAAALGDALLPLLDELSIEHFDLGGLCLGVPVAMAVTRRRPQSVGQLVLHTPVLSAPLVRRSFHLQVAAFTSPIAYPAVVWCKNQRWVSDVYKRLLVEGDNVDRGAAQVNFGNQLRADSRATREWIRDGLQCEDVALLATHPEGALLIVAADDRIVDVQRLRVLCEQHPSLRLFVDGGAGHGWTAAAVERQLAAITNYLDGEPVDAAGSPAA
jgi:pimeloyl-ACP methyl ester carboxylesterase